MTRIQSMEDLIQAKAQAAQAQESNQQKMQFIIRVGMSSCSIAVGAAETLSALNTSIAQADIADVTVQQIGCIGLCALEPVVQVLAPGQAMITYGKVTPDVARRIVTEHIGKGIVIRQNEVENI